MRHSLYGGRSYSLSVSSAQVLRVTNNSNINFSATGQYTWVGRFKIERKVGATVLAQFFVKSSDGVSGFNILIDSSVLAFQERKTNTKWISTNFIPFSLTGQWVDLIITFDGTAQIIKFYLDGIEIESNVSSFSWANLIDDTSSDLTFGKGASTENLQGQMCDLGMYARVLTLSEIRNFSIGIIPTNAQVFIPANDGTGTAPVDTSGKTNTVSISAATMWTGENPTRTRSAITTFSKSLLFDGATSFATLPIAPTSAGFSFAFFIWIPGWNSNFGRIFDYFDGGNNGTRALLNTLANRWISFDSKTAGAGADANGPVGSVRRGVWEHIVLTSNGTLSKQYINAILKQSIASNYAAPTAQTFTLGRLSNASSTFGKFYIRNFVFKPGTPFTQTEINNLFFAGIVPAGVTCYITGDNNAIDQTGNGNDMTLTNVTFSANNALMGRHVATGRQVIV